MKSLYSFLILIFWLFMAPGGGGRRLLLAFFLLGLFNNTGYVVMNAGAKEITPCLVGLVYVANVLPSMSVKLTLPFWQHRVSIRARLRVAASLMVSSLAMVIAGQLNNSVPLALLGVALGAAQSGMGEASLLACAGLYDNSRATLTAWSSGTGMAGPFGYAFVILFTMGFRVSFATTVFVGLLIPLGYYVSYVVVLLPPEENGSEFHPLRDEGEQEEEQHQQAEVEAGAFVEERPAAAAAATVVASAGNSTTNNSISSLGKRRQTAHGMHGSGHHSYPSTNTERLSALRALWPYMVPLFAVYFAEYAMQSGTWAAMGIPDVQSAKDRKDFYKMANWSYQIGVFFSRSSGMLCRFRFKGLFLMPVLQCLFLAFFWANAAAQWWNDWGLVLPCFATGLLGGAVYVGAFSLIAEDIPKGTHRNFALTAASVADSVGIVCADLLGIIIQQQLYAVHGIQGDCSSGRDNQTLLPS